jgi:hypothetical protein
VSEVQADPASRPNSAVLRVRTGPLAGPLLRRVVAMMLARTRCPVDRLQDTMLICDVLGAHACAHAENGRLEFTVLTGADEMELRIGALAPGGARRLAGDTALPGIGDLLAPIVNQVRVERSPTGAGKELLVLDIAFAGALPAGRGSAPKNGGPPSPAPSPPPALHLADQAPPG